MSRDPSELSDDSPEERSDRARELQLQLLVLEAQLDNANFENREAYRRKIAEKRGELDALERDGG